MRRSWDAKDSVDFFRRRGDGRCKAMGLLSGTRAVCGGAVAWAAQLPDHGWPPVKEVSSLTGTAPEPILNAEVWWQGIMDLTDGIPIVTDASRGHRSTASGWHGLVGQGVDNLLSHRFMASQRINGGKKVLLAEIGMGFLERCLCCSGGISSAIRQIGSGDGDGVLEKLFVVNHRDLLSAAQPRGSG